MRFQKTIAREVEITGVGLHTGESIRMRLRPADPDSGYVFQRRDLGGRSVRASVDNVAGTNHATTLARGRVEVSTVEHLLSALYGCGVDNIVCEVDGPEVPILDGSPEPFAQLLEQAGSRRQGRLRQYLEVIQPVGILAADREIAIYPSQGSTSLRVTYAIHFPHPEVGYQQVELDLNRATYRRELARARTFCFLEEVDWLRSQGLCKGGSLDNAIVFDDRGAMNGELRFEDECVRHKAADLLGDLALLGYRVRGHICAYRAGHGLHSQLVRRLLDSPSSWRLVGAGERAVAPPPEIAAGPAPSLVWS